MGKKRKQNKPIIDILPDETIAELEIHDLINIAKVICEGNFQVESVSINLNIREK